MLFSVPKSHKANLFAIDLSISIVTRKQTTRVRFTQSILIRKIPQD
jgi:hypothetical protein